MFVDNKVTKNFEGEEKYDKFAIASTLFDVSFKGAACSVLEARIIRSCDGCNLRYLCGKIDDMMDEYAEKTTVVTSSFNFGG